MIRRQGYTFRLRGLDAATRQALAREAGQARWLYNLFVEFELLRFEAKQKLPTYNARAAALTKLRKRPECAWLAEGSVVSQQRTLRNLDDAWQRLWDDLKLPQEERRGVGPPTFKKKGDRDAFGWSGKAWVELDQERNRIKLPKIGWVRYRNSRRVEGTVMNATVRRVGRKWNITIGTEREVADPAQRLHVAPVGIDLGVTHLATTSDGDHLSGPRAFKRAAKAKAKAQRIFARRKKGSVQRQRQAWKVAKIDRRTANVRKDHLHKLTTQLTKNHGLIAVEALRVDAMTRSAKGTVEAPGVNVRAKAGLNREILDQGWGEMRRQLSYKLEWTGGAMVVVPAKNTSRKCSACGHTSRENRTSQANFACVACGHAMNADVNAAKNILAAGMAAAAGGLPRKERRGRRRYRSACEPCRPVFTAGIPVL